MPEGEAVYDVIDVLPIGAWHMSRSSAMHVKQTDAA